MVALSQEIYVREVELKDLIHSESVQELVNKAYCEEGWTTVKRYATGRRSSTQEIDTYVKESGQPNVLMYAFLKTNDTETVVGTIMIQPSEHHSDEAELGLFAVSPAHQSQGIGRRLMETAHAKMMAMGFKTSAIQVIDARTELLAWYRKLGYKETGERNPLIQGEVRGIGNHMFIVLKKEI